MADQDNIASFASITGATPEQAKFFLESSGDDLQAAISAFYDSGGAAPGAAAPVGAGGHDMMADDNDDEDEEREPEMDFGDDDDDAMANLAPAATTAQMGAMGGGRTLGGVGVTPTPNQTRAPAPAPVRGGVHTLSGATPSTTSSGAGSASSSRSGTPLGFNPRNQPARVATLGSLSAASNPPGGGRSGFGGGSRVGRLNPGADDDDEEDNKEQLEFFTGGEKSGLSVENPNAKKRNAASDMVKGILQKAREGGTGEASGSGAQQSQGRSVFSGSAHTLGGDDTPSTFIPSASGSNPTRLPGTFPGAQDANDAEEEQEGVTRNLTFWRNGFSIEDGDLMPYDDPKNKEILEALLSGRAPLALLKVSLDQRVELRIADRKGEDYVRQPPPPAGPFAGSGHRLGAEAPSISAPVPVPARAPVVAPAGLLFEINESEPVTSLRIRLRDGTTRTARFNQSHTVGDIRRYINYSDANESLTPYVLQTTFPSRDLTDEAATLKDAGLLGSVIVQRGL